MRHPARADGIGGGVATVSEPDDARPVMLSAESSGN